ncbi:Uncharacterized protein GBIM_19429 [Gryllus bimaculatus]|nr:Uncharacterized protein GBIM_19429 [Gryllus bimaculatus]
MEDTGGEGGTVLNCAGTLETLKERKSDPSSARYGSTTSRDSASKAASLYHTITGKVLGSRDSDRPEISSGSDMAAQPQHLHHHLPPPPPPTSRRSQSHPEDVPGTSEFVGTVGCMDVRERLESHLKEKLHDMMGRSALVGRIIRPGSVGEKSDDKGMLSNEEGEYQRISEATTTSPVSDGSVGGVTKQAVRALIHREPTTAASTPTSPHRHRDHLTKMVRLYPASDTEDSVFYTADDRDSGSKSRKQNSCESLTLSTVSVNSQRSSMDLGDRKTLVVVIGTSSKGAQTRLMQKQRSWETFPPKKRGIEERGDGYRKFRDPDSFRSGFECRPQDGGSQGSIGVRGETGGLKKADSFEGHEEAVRTLVAAVQETRSQHLQQQRKQSQPKSSSS